MNIAQCVNYEPGPCIGYSRCFCSRYIPANEATFGCENYKTELPSDNPCHCKNFEPAEETAFQKAVKAFTKDEGCAWAHIEAGHSIMLANLLIFRKAVLDEAIAAMKSVDWCRRHETLEALKEKE